MFNSISRSESFAFLLKTKPVNKTTNFMLHSVSEGLDFKLGILIPKKFAKRAVDRNALKRLIRQTSRQSVPIQFKGQLLVRLTSPVNSVTFSSRAAWSKEISLLLKQWSLR